MNSNESIWPKDRSSANLTVKSDLSIKHQTHGDPDKCLRLAHILLGEMVPHFPPSVILATRSGTLRSKGVLPINKGHEQDARNRVVAQISRLTKNHADKYVDDVLSGFRNLAFHADQMGIADKRELIRKSMRSDFKQ